MSTILLIFFLSLKSSPLFYSPEKILIDSLPEGLRFHISGCISYREGLPDLPVREVLIGIPQRGGVRVEVYPGNYETRRGIDVAPVPKKFPDGHRIYERDLEVYGRDRFYPKNLVRVKNIGWLRNIRVARIEISPIQYNPKRREVRIYRDIRYRLKFSSPPKVLEIPDAFDKLYKRMIINYEECKDWRGTPPPLEVKTPFNNYKEWVKIRIRDAGVYKIGYKDLEKLGISPSLINPKTFKIFNIGKFTPRESYPDSMVEVPIYVYGEEDGSFDKRDYILFYGHPVSYWDYDKEEFIDNPYTFYNCYWLTWGREKGKRMVKRTVSGRGEEINSSVSISHLERDENNPGRGGVLWIWQEFSPGGIDSLDIPFILPCAESLFSISLAFYPEWDSLSRYNKIRVSLNSKTISTLDFEEGSSSCNPIPIVKTVQFNSKIEEKNTLSLKLLGRHKNPIFFDYVEFIYKQRFSLKENDLQVFIDSPGFYELNIEGVSSSPFILNITDYSNPSVISDFKLSKGVLRFKAEIESKKLFYITEEERFLKPSSLELSHPGSLLASTFRPNYIIISPDEFYEGAQVLARYRREKGMENVGAVKISQVYDDFGFGLEDPIAIKRFLSVKQPHYGVFLSDGSYDYRGIRNKMDFKMVPPYEEGKSINPNCAFWHSITAYETWYADWDGNGSTPDMALGRVCVRNKREIGNFLDKLKKYESSPGGWMRRFILLGDDVWAGKPGGKYDGPGHIGNCEAVGDAISDRFDLVKVYLTEYPYKGTPAKPDATKALLREWNKGASGLCYFGHGAGTQLAHENVFNTPMVASLHNGSKLPIALFESCMVGRFDDDKECIAEELVRSPAGASIASMAASGAGGTDSNFALALFSSLLEGITRLGDAFYSAWPLESNSILFGDPAMDVQFPKRDGEIEIEPPYLQLGGETQVRANVDIRSGRYALSVYAPQYNRIYEWTYQKTPYSTQYVLPGKKFYYGLGRIEKGTIKAKFFTPKELGPDKREVEDGTYTKIKNSALITITAWDSKNRYRLYKGSIPIESAGPKEDKEGPKITLYADNRPIMQKDTLPKRFTLKGKLRDPSGILSADINTTPKHDFLFYINKPEEAVYLYDYFRYDEGSDTSGEFSYPVELPQVVDTIVVVTYDNLFNQTIKRVIVESHTTEERLSIKNPIVYPNPIKREGYFTFHLNKPAWVRIKIYTISGRPIKIFEDRLCGYGYNQVYWDGRDGDGDYPANGVYLYKISARSEEGEYQEFLGKLIILK